MAALSDYLEETLLNFLLRGAAFTPPDPVYISLHTADPTDAGGSEVDGTDWTNYARVAVQTDSVNTEWNAAASEGGGGYLSDNANDVDFGTASVTGTQADVTHVGIYDAASGGNLLFHAALATSKPITDGDPVKFPAGQLDVILR